MKKANKNDLGLPLNKFIKKCWEDNRGLRRQFYNEWRKCADRDSESVRREYEPKLKKFKKDIDSAVKCPLDKNDFQDDKPSPKPIEESWNKKQGSRKKSKLSGVYQRPPSKRLHFSATDKVKEARKEGKHTTHDLDSDVEEQHVDKISNKTSQKRLAYILMMKISHFVLKGTLLTIT